MLKRVPGTMADREAWLNALQRGKAKPTPEQLATTTVDGLTIQALYGPPADGEQRAAEEVPLPGPRAGETPSPWRIQQTISSPNLEDAARQIIDDLDGGSDQLALLLDPHGRAGRGVPVRDVEDLDRCLAGVDLERVPLHLESTGSPLVALAALVALAQARGADPGALRGHVLLDPIAQLATEGGVSSALPAAWDAMADALYWARDHAPGLRLVGADTTCVHNAGGGRREELAVAVVAGLETLRAMEARGLNPEDVLRGMTFTLRLSSDFLVGVAACRALRMLWARVSEACGVDEPLHLHARQSTRDLTARDPWVNILRGTTAAFAGAVGGANLVSVEPYDSRWGQPSDEARRLARNTQNILKHEASLDRVCDPARGSWALERMTHELAEAAWDLALELEEAGGMIASLVSGDLWSRIQRRTEDRQGRIAHRTQGITGVSTTPDLGERVLERAPWPQGQSSSGRAPADLPSPGEGVALDGLIAWTHQEGIATSNFLATTAQEPDITPLPERQTALPFEHLRDRSDGHLEERGERPGVFLANVGLEANYNQRSTFVRNLLAAGGLEGQAADGLLTMEDTRDAFQASGRRVAVICASETDLETRGVAIVQGLVAGGADAVWVAGPGAPLRTSEMAEHISGTLALGGDAVRELTRLWEQVTS